MVPNEDSRASGRAHRVGGDAASIGADTTGYRREYCRACWLGCLLQYSWAALTCGMMPEPPLFERAGYLRSKLSRGGRRCGEEEADRKGIEGRGGEVHVCVVVVGEGSLAAASPARPRPAPISTTVRPWKLLRSLAQRGMQLPKNDVFGYVLRRSTIKNEAGEGKLFAQNESVHRATWQGCIP